MAYMVTYLADPHKQTDLIVSGKRISFKGGVPVEVPDFVGTSILNMPRKNLFKVEFIRPIPIASEQPESVTIFKKTRTAKKIKQGKIS